MRFIVAIGLIFLLALSFSSISDAAEGVGGRDEAVSKDAMGHKAERGIKNVLFGWTEIPKRVVDITKESRNPFWGLVAGIFQGTGKAFARTASGICDVATAPIRPSDKPFIQEDMDIE